MELLLLSISRHRLSARVAPQQGSILSTDKSHYGGLPGAVKGSFPQIPDQF